MIIRRTLHDDWWKVLAYTAILALNMVATILAFPTFETNFAQVMNLVPDFLSFIKNALESASAGATRLAVFAGINHFFKGANIIGPAAAIILALGTVVREVEIGTIGLLLSRPVSRHRILLSFAVVHITELIVPLVLVSALLPLAAERLIDHELELAPFLLATAHGSAFIVLIYGISLLTAVVLSEQIKVAAVAGGLCILSFMLYFIEATRPFTLYRLSSLDIYVGLVRGDPFPWTAFSFCLVGATACLGAALLVFSRRDY